MFVGMRLSDKKDKDLIEALDNAKNITKEVKKLMRLGLESLNNGRNVTVQNVEKPAQKIAQKQPKPVQSVQQSSAFVFTTDEDDVNIEDLEDNILGSF